MSCNYSRTQQQWSLYSITHNGLLGLTSQSIFPGPTVLMVSYCQEMTEMRVLPRVVACVLVLLWALSGRPRVVDAHVFVAPLCNVTEESGLTTDCAQVIGYLQFLDNADCCVHEHREVGRCTTMHVAGTCRARICSLPFVPLPRCQPCRAVAEYVRSVTNLCAQDIAGASRSGGYQVMEEDEALFIDLY